MGKINIRGAFCSGIISVCKRDRQRRVLCVLAVAATMVLLSACGNSAQKEPAPSEVTTAAEEAGAAQGTEAEVSGAAQENTDAAQANTDAEQGNVGTGTERQGAADTAASGGQDQSEAQPDSSEDSASRIESTIQTITSQPHSTGTAGEKAVAEYIDQYLSALGYETTQMPFAQEPVRESDSAISGTNVIAVRHADSGAADADIVIIGAHHDAKPGIAGADDNASGVAVLLETARLLAKVPTDTELRFVSFSGEEDGRVGSRYYAESLTEEEKARVLGQIQVDEIGYKRSDSLKLCTVDGKGTFLANLLLGAEFDSDSVVLEKEIYREALSDHNSFVSAGIPAVLLEQGDYSFENHSILDTPDLIDTRVCAAAARYLADALEVLMADPADSYAADSRAVSPNLGYAVQADTSLWFGNDRNFVENMMGLSGETAETGTNEYGDKTETVRYPIRWFGMEEQIPTDFYYRNGFLEEVDIPYEEATGQTMEQAVETLTAFLGEPTGTGEEYGGETSWDDPIYHKYTAVAPLEDGGYKVYVLDDNYGQDLRNAYSLGEELSALEQKAYETAQYPEQDLLMLEMALQVVWPEDRPMIELQLYTDGYHNSTGMTAGISYDDNTRMQYSIDVADAFEDGEAVWRDYNKTLKTMVHEYGHALAENAGQVDVSGTARAADDTLPVMMYQDEAFAQDAYLRVYYEKFWAGQDVRSGIERYKEKPQEYVDSYAGTDIREDFAETFALFVLGDKPEGDTVAEEKIRFFYDYEEMTARREFIRENFSLK